MSDSISEQVQALYHKFPYPPREAGEAFDPYIDYLRCLSSAPSKVRPSFLDAGCGTGSSVLGGALFGKEWDIYGCDFNQASLDLLQRDIDELNLPNVSLRQVDLLDFPQDFGPEGGFDVIFCTGVIHHTADPLGILQSLAARLAPQGILRLMVYAERGREGLYRFARAVQGLQNESKQTLEERLHQAQDLMRHIQARGHEDGLTPPSLRGPFQGSAGLSAAEFADRYLHPHDSPYTLNLLKSHIEKAGLSFLRWFEQRNWDLCELLPTTSEDDLPQDEWEKYEIVEELFDRDQYDLLLVGPDFKPDNRAFTFDCPLRINPQVHLTQTTFRGYPASTQAKLLFYPSEQLSHEQARVLKAVSQRTATLKELLTEWGEETTEDWFRAGLYLLYRDLVYRPKSED